MFSKVLRTAALGAVLAVGGLAASAGAFASGMLHQIAPQDVTAALDEIGMGYSVELDPRGFPMVQVDVSVMPAQQFNILFFACDELSGACEDITLWSWYDASGLDVQGAINAWNDPFQGMRRWSTGYLDDENDPALILNVNATGGLGAQNLQLMLNTYVEDMFAFEEGLAGGAMADASDADEAQPVLTAALLNDEIAYMTRLVKDYGGSAFSQTKQTDKK